MATEIANADNVYTIHKGFIYSTDEAAYAKAWQAEKDGEAKRGRVSGETLEAWKEAGSPEVTLPEKTTVGADTSNVIVATLVARKLDKNGKLTKNTTEIPITRGDVREFRGKVRGRYTSEQLLGSVMDKITDDLAPIEIREADDTVHAITEAEDGQWSATRDKEKTEESMKSKNTVLMNRIAELERILAEREEAKG